MARVSVAARAVDTASLWRTLVSPDLAIQDVDKEAGVMYSQELIRAVAKRRGVLTHGEIQLIVDKVNENLDKDLDIVEAVKRVNNAPVNRGVGLVELTM